MRRIALTLLPVLLLAIGVETIGTGPDLGSYERLRPEVLRPSDDPVFGEGTYELALTYGLALKAAVAAGDDASVATAQHWLSESKLLGGWGMDGAWDPFADGTVTPSETPFALGTAMAIDGLMDAGLGDAEAADIGRMLVGWAERAWSNGSYWYSQAPQDAIDVPNASALMTGVTARFLREYGDATLTAAERDLLASRVQDSLDHLAATADPDLRWSYSGDQSIVNETNRHAYILWGAELAREAGFDVGWTREEAVASLDAYGPVYPPDVEETRDMLRRDDSEWETAGTGMALAWAARWGGDLTRWTAGMCESLAIAPRAPRFDAHALLGMAMIGWCDCPERQPLVPGVVRSC